jgi:hypothetical protein
VQLLKMAEISILSGQTSITFVSSDAGLEAEERGSRVLSTLTCKPNTTVQLHTWWNVVGAKVEGDELEVNVVQTNSNGVSSLLLYRGHYEGNQSVAHAWVEKVLARAYPSELNLSVYKLQIHVGIDCKPGRRLQVLVNPFGGKGKALKILKQMVEPILEAGQSKLNITCQSSLTFSVLILSHEAQILLTVTMHMRLQRKWT